MGPNWLTLDVLRRGETFVRVRFTPYWRLSGVQGCVEPAGDFTRVLATSAGPARLTISFALGRIGARSPRCE
jgi:hypothetical protein